MKTKTCTLKVTGELANEEWLNKQCGCQFNKLKFLDIHEVSRKAAFGVKFKVTVLYSAKSKPLMLRPMIKLLVRTSVIWVGIFHQLAW